MVSSNHLNRLFTDKLQARTGCLKISRQACASSGPRQPPASPPPELSVNKENLEPNRKPQEAKLTIKTMTRPAQASGSIFATQKDNKAGARRRARSLPRAGPLAGSTLPVLLVLLVLLALCDQTGRASRPAGGSLGRDGAARAPLDLTPSPLTLRRVGASLLRQLGQLVPIRRPAPAPTRGSPSDDRPGGTRTPGRQASPLSRFMSRVRQQIGARNTIRVHNAFRDVAWRLLSGLSMPTPVIYELRRQNLYPPEEDVANDQLFDRNTTKTIRIGRRIVRRAGDDEDDDPET